MVALATIPQTSSLPALIDRASNALISARSAAEVLEARDMASAAYDAAKRASRIGKAKKAADDLITAAYRVQADALEIEAGAKRRLADEYDAAQERGEINSHGGDRKTDDFKFENSKLENIKPAELHEARIIRDAEKEEPGIVRRALDQMLGSREEPTKARVRRVVLEAARPQAVPKAPPGRGKDAIRERVLEAIMILSGLPPAHEVSGYFVGADTAIIISERLPAASRWLADFNNAWKDSGC